MQSPTRKKTGGRVAGVKNKATLARETAQASAAPSDLFPVSRTRARAKDSPKSPASSPPTSRKVDKIPTAPSVVSTFPRYKLARVDQLVPYANNARTHSPEQVEKIAASIREFGFTNPILTDGKRGIVAGHGRVLAAELLAMDVVPSIELSHLTEAQRRAYILADNRLALDAGWDDELLRIELGELRDEGFDLSLTGFELPELDKLFADGPDAPTGFPSFNEDIETEHECPKCGYKFSGGKVSAKESTGEGDEE